MSGQKDSGAPTKGVKGPKSPSAESKDHVDNDVPQKAAHQEPDRGRHADAPSEIPSRGWLDVLWRTNRQLAEDNLSIVAAGVAFYVFIAIVPALAAMIAIYALITDPGDIARQIEALARTMPREVMPLLDEQITRIASNDQAAGWSAVVGIAIALFSSSKAITALMAGLNIAYDEEEKRGFFKLQAWALFLTLVGIVGAVTVIGILAVLPKALEFAHISGGAEAAIMWLRWPALLALFVVALSAVYRFGPCRNPAQWKWVSPGAIVASILWVIGSGLFSLYVSRFGGYDKTYGSLGAVIVFLMWLYLSAYVVLLGAELNSEMERQTLKDTTKGEPEPLGKRDAYAADTVGKARGAA
jgi:membrane protein